MNPPAVKWYGINALEFRHSKGSFMIDPYVSRDNQLLHIPGEVDKYIVDPPDFVLMTHAHWDHLPDMPYILSKFNTVLYASKTACNIMRAMGVAESQLYELTYGEELLLPGNVKVTALESRHMGIVGEPEGYAGVPENFDPTVKDNWRCGETFAFLIEVDGKRLLNIGTANMYEPVIHGMECDYLLCGISRWKEGFPELLSRNIVYDTLIPTHHDEFTLKLDDFYLREDMERLKKAIPGIKYKEMPILQWMTLG